MTAWSSKYARLVSLLFLATLLAFTYAQEEVGIVSYIDIEGAGLQVGSCLGEEPDPRACVPNVEVIDVEAFKICGGNLSGCKEKVAYPVPFISEEAGIKVEADIYKAWEMFVDSTIGEVSGEINQLPPCWLPTPCPPQVDWTCVANQMATALEMAYTNYLPEYWASVYESIATHAPFALYWRSAFPGDGAVIAPVFSLEPKPEQYADFVEEPRDTLYYFQGPMFPRLPVPYQPDELDKEYGGITELEVRKRKLEPATLLEYQQFGFVTLFEVYGEFRLEILFKFERGPYLLTACLVPFPPFILPVPLPVPAPVYVPRAFTDWSSVPEGYGIPRVKGQTLF